MQKAKIYDLKERCFQFSIEVIEFLKRLPNEYICQTIGSQLLRSATSIGANIIEAQAASSRKDFTNFYNISLKSANETKYWLALLRQAKKQYEQDIKILEKEVEELSKIIARSLLTLKGK